MLFFFSFSLSILILILEIEKNKIGFWRVIDVYEYCISMIHTLIFFPSSFRSLI